LPFFSGKSSDLFIQCDLISVGKLTDGISGGRVDANGSTSTHAY
jgi:hypothetical protein